jgi:hypothetical protein
VVLFKCIFWGNDLNRSSRKERTAIASSDDMPLSTVMKGCFHRIFLKKQPFFSADITVRG